MRWEPITDFTKALREEEMRANKNWGLYWRYKYKGFYYSHLMRYYNLFNHEQIKVYLYEDLKSNPSGLVKDIFQFLGVDRSFDPDVSIKYMAGSPIPRSRTLKKFLAQDNQAKSVVVRLIPEGLGRRLKNWLQNFNDITPEFPLGERRQLTQLYREDILNLQDLIQRDLSKWLE